MGFASIVPAGMGLSMVACLAMGNCCLPQVLRRALPEECSWSVTVVGQGSEKIDRSLVMPAEGCFPVRRSDDRPPILPQCPALWKQSWLRACFGNQGSFFDRSMMMVRNRHIG